MVSPIEIFSTPHRDGSAIQMIFTEENSGKRIYYSRTIKQVFTIRAEPAFFPIEVIQCQRVMHDAFRDRAVIKPEQMSDLMGTFFYGTVDQIILVPLSAIKFIGETGG
jgi:hypothetical protein